MESSLHYLEIPHSNKKKFLEAKINPLKNQIKNIYVKE